MRFWIKEGNREREREREGGVVCVMPCHVFIGKLEKGKGMKCF